MATIYLLRVDDGALKLVARVKVLRHARARVHRESKRGRFPLAHAQGVAQERRARQLQREGLLEGPQGLWIAVHSAVHPANQNVVRNATASTGVGF